MKTMSLTVAKPLSATLTSASSENRLCCQSVALVKAPRLHRNLCSRLTSAIVSSLNGAATSRGRRRPRVKAFARNAVVIRASSSDASSSSSFSSFEKDIDPAKLLMERQQFLFVDMRTEKMYEKEHNKKLN